MPSLIDQLARRLDTSPDQARQRLRTLLAALRSRVERNGQTSLPGLGTFSREGGAWTFEPDETLARSVNRSFDDLDPVGVPVSAAGAPPSSKEAPAETSFEAASPAASAAEESPSEEPGSSEDDLFEGVSFGESASEESAAESTTPDATEEASEETTSSPSAPRSAAPEEEEAHDWSLVGASSSEASESSGRDWRYAALPAGYLIHQRTTSPSPEAVRAGRLEAVAEDAPERERPATRRAADRPREERRSEETPAEGAAAPERSTSRSESGLGGWLAALVVLLVVGLGVWFVLGQQGVTTGPLATFQQQVGGGEGASPEATAGQTAPGADAAAADSAAQDTAAGAATEAPSAYAQAERFDRAEGGWTVVVASETSRDTARRTAQQFARQFQNQNYPIDILEATVDDTTRYRVIVGQFSSREAASQSLQQESGRFPSGAWNLQVEPGS